MSGLTFSKLPAGCVWWGVLWLGLSAPVMADGPLMPAQVPSVNKQESPACHTAYPPGLLPAASWRRIMGGLDRHYGSDASLEPA